MLSWPNKIFPVTPTKIKFKSFHYEIRGKNHQNIAQENQINCNKVKGGLDGWSSGDQPKQKKSYNLVNLWPS